MALQSDTILQAAARAKSKSFVKSKSFERSSLSSSSTDLSGLGGSLAVGLYLDFLLEGAAFSLVCFLMELPCALSNRARNERRNAHREAFGSNQTLLSGIGLYGLGACDEEGIPTTDYCLAAEGSSSVGLLALFWLGDLIVFLLFVARLQFMQVRAAREFDLQHWKTSDYAVMVSGLREGVQAASLREALVNDLGRLGFARESIAHVALGLKCAAEEAAVQKEEQLAQRAETLRARARRLGDWHCLSWARLPAGALDCVRAPLLQWLERLQTANDAALDAARQHAAEKIAEPDVSTGHAYITFQLEVDRNRMIKLFASRGAVATSGARHTRSAVAYEPLNEPSAAATIEEEGRVLLEASAAAPPGNVTVHVAPEPSNVRWIALELTKAERFERRQRTRAWLLLLLLCSTLLLWLFTYLQSSEQVHPALAAVVLLAITMHAFQRLREFHSAEGYQTTSSAERGHLLKLGLLFLLCQLAVPFLVGGTRSVLRHGAVFTQQFYEAHGVLEKVAVLIISLRLLKDVPKALQLVSLTKRAYAAVAAASPADVERAWEPPRMRLSEQHASSYFLVACLVLCAPLAPPLYLLGAFAMLVSYGCTKVGVVFWYCRPPAVRTELLGGMVQLLLHTTWLQLGLKLCASLAAAPGEAYTVILPLAAAASLLLGGTSSVLRRGYIEWLYYTTVEDGRAEGGSAEGSCGAPDACMAATSSSRSSGGGKRPPARRPSFIQTLMASHVHSAASVGDLEAAEAMYESSCTRLDVLDTDGIRYDDVFARKGYHIDAFCHPYEDREIKDKTAGGRFFGAEASLRSRVHGRTRSDGTWGAAMNTVENNSYNLSGAVDGLAAEDDTTLTYLSGSLSS